MKYEELIQLTDKLPVIKTAILNAGRIDIKSLKVQISRWAKAGKLIQLKRGVYVLAEPYRKKVMDQAYVAGVLEAPSYISLEKALEYHGLIPEATFVYTSITTKRPVTYKTPVGVFSYRHVRRGLFWGYEAVAFSGQTGFMACAEKALLDYFYFYRGRISNDFFEEMRFQNLDHLDLKKLKQYAKKFAKPKVARAAELFIRFMSKPGSEDVVL